MDWKILQKQEFDYLDTIDLKIIISIMRDRSIHEIMGRIEDIYEQAYLRKNNDECLFSVIDEQDFIDYINKRYGIKYKEKTEYYFDI